MKLNLRENNLLQSITPHPTNYFMKQGFNTGFTNITVSKRNE